MNHETNLVLLWNRLVFSVTSVLDISHYDRNIEVSYLVHSFYWWVVFHFKDTPQALSVHLVFSPSLQVLVDTYSDTRVFETM